MIREEGNRALVDGAMNLSSATALLEAGKQAIGRSAQVFDLEKVAEVDSAGLAVVFGWMRAAASVGRALQIVNAPTSLISMADVYGVGNLLPLA